MSHKVHPKIYRIKELKDWNSRWLDKRVFSQYLKEDFRIRSFLKKKLKEVGVGKIEIERFPGKINIIILASRPGIIIGRSGEGVERIKKEIEEKILKNKKKGVRIEIRDIKNPWSNAILTSQWIAQQLEKRIHFRRVIKQGLTKIMADKEVKGVRIELSGRLNGAEIARKELLTKGNLPRQTLRADIDYGKARAYCTYGVIGVKVWIYKGERFAK